jgi:hypothetical protein
MPTRHNPRDGLILACETYVHEKKHIAVFVAAFYKSQTVNLSLAPFVRLGVNFNF